LTFSFFQIHYTGPPVKTEISKVLNAITMMGQNLQMAMTARRLPTLDPDLSNAPASKLTTRGRIDAGWEQQAVSVICS